MHPSTHYNATECAGAPGNATLDNFNIFICHLLHHTFDHHNISNQHLYNYHNPGRAVKDLEAPIFLNDDFASALDVLARCRDQNYYDHQDIIFIINVLIMIIILIIVIILSSFTHIIFFVTLA